MPTIFVQICSFLLLASVAVAHMHIDRHRVPCGTQQKVCQCRETADECEFTLLIEEIHTFVAYELDTSNEDYVPTQDDQQNTLTREEEGTPFYINSTGYLVPSFTHIDGDGDLDCNTFDEDFKTVKCNIPLTVDGKTYRPVVAVNGQVPGPTIVVYENQTVIANVINKLMTETTAIHWHGILQRNTPWMDGALHVNQCPIGPSESFKYYFKAEPSGTFWYHSHRVTQRADGLFGGLIVRESAHRRALLQERLGISPIIDDPGTQTLNLHEWDVLPANSRYPLLKSQVGVFHNKPLGVIPVPLSEQSNSTEPYVRYAFSFSSDRVAVGSVQFFSGLINGKGRHKDVPFIKTRLEVFTVDSGSVYRFRLIGEQINIAYKFSIDEHNLTVIATDGNLIEPVEAQFVIVHIGERYDFLLKANKPRQDVDDYWIRAETLEVDLTTELPHPSLGNLAEGILHYAPAPSPRSTDYEAIKSVSIPFDIASCGAIGGCVVVNCPFPVFHPSYNIRQCVNIKDFRLLFPTPSKDLPSADIDHDCEDCELFFNAGFSRIGDSSEINGRVLKLPQFPLLTQRESIPAREYCDPSTPCENGGKPCHCIHVREVTSFNKTVRIVVSNVGDEVQVGHALAHPFHLHGHHYHVVDVGYGSYANGTFMGRNEDILCNDSLCSIPSWRGNPPTFSISNRTVRKDTIIVPAGGYVVIQFLSDNPGFWFFHCHMIEHMLAGMAVVINEVESRQNPAPPGYPTCGGYDLDQKQFYESLAFNPDNSSSNFLMSVWVLTAALYLTFIIIHS